MGDGNRFFFWPDDAERICAAIRKTKEVLRIVLKTKNEELLLERWIRHHLHILGDAGTIIVLDNMSDSDIVHDVYAKYAANLIVVKFSGNFDWVHIVNIFEEMYKAIWDSSLYYTFIDTDEFLHFYDGKKVTADSSILSYLEKNKNINFFSPYWLVNAYYTETIFMFPDDIKSILNKVLFGKPIINSMLLRNTIYSRGRFEMIIHSAQLPVAAYGVSPSCFVLLHRSKLSRTHRIKANMEKLATLGVIKDAQDFSSVITLDVDTLPHSGHRGYINEVRLLMEDLRRPDGAIPADGIGPGHIEVHPDGALSFYPPELEKTFRAYVSQDVSWLDITGADWSIPRPARCTFWEVLDPESHPSFAAKRGAQA